MPHAVHLRPLCGQQSLPANTSPNRPPAARMPPTAESRASAALVSVAAGMCSTFSLQGEGEKITAVRDQSTL